MEARLIDTAKTEAFGGKLIGVLNGGAIALMTSVGHRTGLFDTMSGMAPSTSAQIARAAELDERYVREWLAAMVVGGFVECYAEGTLFYLPPEHASWLTRAAGADNIAVFSQYISVLGSVEDEIVGCFRNGGGVPYSEFHRFHEVMAEDSGQSVVSSLVDAILPLVPGLVESLGRGIDVLDVGCGSGRALNVMAKSFPASRFTGYDISDEALETARAEAERIGSRNIRFEKRDVSTLHDVDAFDLITAFDAIHDQAAPDIVLAGIARALRPAGTFLMQDIAGSSHVHKNLDHPIGAVLYTISCMHCMTVSLAQGGAGLGAMWGKETALEMLSDAGFGRVDVKRLDHDIQNNYYLATLS